MVSSSSFYQTTGPTYEGDNPSSSSNDGALIFIIDGGNTTIIPGAKADVEIPFFCTINSITLVADQVGFATVDLLKAPIQDYPPVASICGPSQPALLNAATFQDTVLSGWTNTLNAGDILRPTVSDTTNVTRLTVTLKITKG